MARIRSASTLRQAVAGQWWRCSSVAGRLRLGVRHQSSAPAARSITESSEHATMELLRHFSRSNAFLLTSLSNAQPQAPMKAAPPEPRPVNPAAPSVASDSSHITATTVSNSKLHSMYIRELKRATTSPLFDTVFHADTEGLTMAALDALAAVNSKVSDLSVQDEYTKKKWQQQLDNEIRSADEAVERFRTIRQGAFDRKELESIPECKALMNQWYAPLVEAIKQEQDMWTRRPAPGHVHRSLRSKDNYPMYLLQVPPEKLAVITLSTVVNELMARSGTCLLSKIAVSAGRAVQLQQNMDAIQQQARKIIAFTQEQRKEMEALEGDILKLMNELGMDPMNARLAFDSVEVSKPKFGRVAKLKNEKLVDERKRVVAERAFREFSPGWPVSALAKLGAFLVACLVNTATISIYDPNEPSKRRLEPAFHHSVEWGENPYGKAKIRRYGIIAAHEEVIQKLTMISSDRDIAVTRYFPMVIPPLPWIAYDTGGHLALRCLVMRTRGDRHQLRLLREADQSMVFGEPGMTTVYEALNALGSVGWIINKDMLEVVEEAWRRGGDIAELPRQDRYPTPAKPLARFRLHVQNGQLLCATFKPASYELREYNAMAAKIKKKNAEMHSHKCDFTYKLDVAQQLKDEPVIYFPHNVDFRGRAYPMHPYLSHLGPDVCRGLLLFAEAKPLGENGLEWLFIQAANLFGANKMSLEDRQKFIEERLDQVRECAINPLDGSRWWTEADEPWQFLAACKEIVKAIDSGDPASYISHLPVHQDGSCNGLQHYAALGRDYRGAQAVNLTDVDKPQDVYSGIATMVKDQVDRDVSSGHEWAKHLQNDVDRKLVKQTVMTSVYGVTFLGARHQIARRLKDRGWDDDKIIFHTSKYAASVTMSKLHEMFTSAKDIMKWLNECARRIAAAGHSVEWVTPLGLPVVQPYRAEGNKTIKTILQRLHIKADHSEDLPVMKARQRSAFPPNYIHSIDSSHMMMTAIECRARGLSFAGVHDSFWTHAGSIHVMNQVLREKFLELHSRPLLEELKTYFEERFPDVELPELPRQGNLQLEEIRKAKYFFS